MHACCELAPKICCVLQGAQGLYADKKKLQLTGSACRALQCTSIKGELIIRQHLRRASSSAARDASSWASLSRRRSKSRYATWHAHTLWKHADGSQAARLLVPLLRTTNLHMHMHTCCHAKMAWRKSMTGDGSHGMTILRASTRSPSSPSRATGRHRNKAACCTPYIFSVDRPWLGKSKPGNGGIDMSRWSMTATMSGFTSFRPALKRSKICSISPFCH